MARWMTKEGVLDRIRRESFNPGLLGLVFTRGFIIRRGLWSFIARSAPAIKGRVVDIGCGSRPYERLFVNADTYVGLDIEQSGHDHKRSDIDVFYDGKKLPFADGEFDAAVSFEVFEHIFNPDEILGEIHRVLRDDGKPLITIPFLWPEHEQPFDFGRYTSFGIRSMLERNGFRVERVDKSGNFVAALWQAAIQYTFKQFSPKKFLPGRALFQIVVIFPMTLLGLVASSVLPKSYDAFCSLVVLAEKRKAIAPTA